MRVSDSYFKRLRNFLESTAQAFNYSEDSEYRGTTKIIPTIKLKKGDYSWFISSREEGIISLVVVADKTYYGSIDVKQEKITLSPEDFPEGVGTFAERLVYLKNNAIDFILSR